MDDLRIARIKHFGDKLANYVRAENGKRFFGLLPASINIKIFGSA